MIDVVKPRQMGTKTGGEKKKGGAHDRWGSLPSLGGGGARSYVQSDLVFHEKRCREVGGTRQGSGAKDGGSG